MKYNCLVRYRYYFLVMTLSVLATGGLAQDSSVQKGLLWRVDKSGFESSYLFGTIHSEDTRVTRLSPVVQKHFEHAASLTLEVTMNAATILHALTGMYLKPSQSLDKLIDAKEYQHLIKVLKEYGMPEDAVKRLKPWATMVIISMPKPKTGIFLDRLLEEKAKKSNKPVYGLETAEEQIQSMDTLSLEKQVILLKETLSYMDKMPDILEKLHKLYLAGDLVAMLKFSKDYMRSEDPKTQAISDEFMTHLVDERSLRMVERMQERLQEGNAFIAVGALHLPGEQGIIRLLEQRGYRLSALD